MDGRHDEERSRYELVDDGRVLAVADSVLDEVGVLGMLLVA